MTVTKQCPTCANWEYPPNRLKGTAWEKEFTSTCPTCFRNDKMPPEAVEQNTEKIVPMPIIIPLTIIAIALIVIVVLIFIVYFLVKLLT